MSLLASSALGSGLAAAPRRKTTHIACGAAAGRRAVVGGVIVSAPLMLASKALALIPDDEDEALLERAKANRKERMARERVIEREFMQTEGLKNARLESKIGPAQSSVNQIVKAGAALEKGDASGAAQALSGLAGSISAALGVLSTTDEAKTLAGSVVNSVNALASAASQGDVSGAKSAYVTAVGQLVEWASAAGVKDSLTSL